MNVRIQTVSKTNLDSVWFTTKGQVVIPAWLRRQFDIEDGTRAVVQATPEGILLKPMTAPSIRRLRGLIKRKPGEEPFDQWWAKYKTEEKQLEEAKYARSTRRVRQSRSAKTTA